MALPADGPATRDGVKSFLRLTGAGDDVEVDACVAAVNAAFATWPSSRVADGAADWTGFAHLVRGANMLAGRLFRRRNSPDGVAAFTDQGAAYVQRTDPDVALLLGLGAYAKPSVG